MNLVNEDLMSNWRKFTSNYELDTAKGVVSAKDPEDHARMLEALAELKVFSVILNYSFHGISVRGFQ
ncbi:MAG: hypothetical protein EXR34_08980 [Rhodoferax sp.]|nr:hypothetical protein [Rhodoferax sp.]